MVYGDLRLRINYTADKSACAVRVAAQLLAYLVYLVALGQRVEDGVHAVEHGDHLHGAEPGADLREGDDVGEQDGHTVKHLRQGVVKGR